MDTTPSNLPARGNTARNVDDRKGLRNRAERAISEFVVAEVFLVQATIEGASVLGDRIEEARKALGEGQDIGSVLKDTGQAVWKPFQERLSYFRQMREQPH